MRWCRIIHVVALCLVASLSTASMKALDDAELSDVTGEGLAIGLDEFRFTMTPRSYFEQVGNTPLNACTGGNTENCWRRGDLRWYGYSLSGVGLGKHWDGSACQAGGLACAVGGVVPWFAPFDNPYIIRAAAPYGLGVGGEGINTGDPADPSKSIYEFVAPSQQPHYSLSFWGEIEVGRKPNPLAPWDQQQGTRKELLKSQTLIQGNAANSIFRLFQFTDPDNQTFGLTYHSYLQGDFRFSVAQQEGYHSDEVGVPVRFDEQEGLHFRNVDAYIPFGQPYYQALVVGALGTGGGFYLEIPQLPNVPAVYEAHYGLLPGDTEGYTTARRAFREGYTTEEYAKTHGYSRWGDWFPDYEGSVGATRNAADDTSSGIVFKACEGCDDFYTYAYRPLRVDVRQRANGGIGAQQSMQRNQSYGCMDPSGDGPVQANCSRLPSELYTQNRMAVSTANIGDARLEGMMMQYVNLTSCAVTKPGGGSVCD